jgi:hypothetical protein
MAVRRCVYVIYKVVPLVENSGVEVKSRKCCQVHVDHAERLMLVVIILYVPQTNVMTILFYVREIMSSLFRWECSIPSMRVRISHV